MHVPPRHKRLPPEPYRGGTPLNRHQRRAAWKMRQEMITKARGTARAKAIKLMDKIERKAKREALAAGRGAGG